MKGIKTILRGVGQVMLQNNALTGLLFLVGIFYNSWILGLGAILGNVVSTISAACFKYPKEDIENGLYGFNGTLVGIAVLFLFGVNLISVLAIIVGAVFSSVVMFVLKEKIPALTAPFVLSTWAVIFFIKYFTSVSFISSSLIQNNSFNLFSAIGMSFGQVLFQESIMAGLIFILAIFINSRVSGFYALYGSILGSVIAFAFSFPVAMINIGLFGYNAILCGVALEDKKWSGFIFATCAIILSVLLNFYFREVGIIALTAPFVLATWGVLLVKKYLLKN